MLIFVYDLQLIFTTNVIGKQSMIMSLYICLVFQLRLFVLLTAVICSDACRLEMFPEDTTSSPEGDVATLSIGKNITMPTFFQNIK